MAHCWRSAPSSWTALAAGKLQEALAGILMIAGGSIWIAGPAIFIGTRGTVSVIKAVYVDKRDLMCACAGGR